MRNEASVSMTCREVKICTLLNEGHRLVLIQIPKLDRKIYLEYIYPLNETI